MNPELKAAIERLRREVANHMLGMEGETDAFSADILAVCTALDQAMRVVEAAKTYVEDSYAPDKEFDYQRYERLRQALAAMEEK